MSDEILTPSTRVHHVDTWLRQDLTGTDFTNRLFIRLIAKGHRFDKVDFKYAVFDSCYLRDCRFDSCNFTGCRFISTNMHGSTFVGCKFDYATFDQTFIDNSILSDQCPAYENLKVKFARSLRMNYLQLGEVDGVNKAIGVELAATELHLRKAWRSNESYYRKKYSGLQRLMMFLSWARFKLLDWVWGNGESIPKLLRAGLIVLIAMAIVDVLVWRDSRQVGSYAEAFVSAPQILLGTLTPESYSTAYLSLIMMIRLLALGFLTSMIVRRFSRR